MKSLSLLVGRGRRSALANAELFKEGFVSAFGVNDNLVEMENLGVSVQCTVELSRFAAGVFIGSFGWVLFRGHRVEWASMKKNILSSFR